MSLSFIYILISLFSFFLFFFFNDTAPTEIYTLSLHDALPILVALAPGGSSRPPPNIIPAKLTFAWGRDVPTLYLVAEDDTARSEEHTSELQSPMYLVCRLLLEKKKKKKKKKKNRNIKSSHQS